MLLDLRQSASLGPDTTELGACFTTPSGLGVVASGAPSRPLDVSGTANGAAGYSVLPRIDKERDNGLFAKRFGGFQAVQTLNKHEAHAVRPD